jgi:hypothetical protein
MTIEKSCYLAMAALAIAELRIAEAVFIEIAG